MKKFLKITAVALLISTSPFCLAQSADTLAKQIIQAQRGQEQEALLTQLSDMISSDMVTKWGEQLTSDIPEAKREKLSQDLNNELDKFRADVLTILKKESENVEMQDMVGFYTKNFTPDELKVMADWYRSATFKKFQSLADEFASLYMQKLEVKTKTALEKRQNQFNSKAQSMIDAAKK